MAWARSTWSKPESHPRPKHRPRYIKRHSGAIPEILSGRISNVVSILAVLEIIAPTEQYLVSERWMAAFTASGSIWPRSTCLISTRVK